jgi:hypothetical protein
MDKERQFEEWNFFRERIYRVKLFHEHELMDYEKGNDG